MLVKNLESKIKLTFVVSVLSFASCILICIIVAVLAFKLIINEREHIYVIDHGIPILAQRSYQDDNTDVEARGHVNLFHSLFFNIPPDDKYMEKNIRDAMYLIDESGLKQHNDLKEKGFYNAILANSILHSVKCDSITLINAEQGLQFYYYGTQRIERATSILYRSLITTGFLRRVPRSDNNSHGFIITNWKTVENNDIEHKQKRIF
jgi:conjugative transposon TraK protein